MAAPIRTSSTNTATTVSIVFDQSLIAPLGRPGEGFTVTVNGIARYATYAALATTTLANDTVQLTMSGYLGSGDTIVVSYSNAGNNIQNAGFETAASFSNVLVTNNSTHPSLLSAVCCASGVDADTVTLTFSLPVASTGGFLTGTTLKRNGTAVSLTSVTRGDDYRQVKIKATTSFQFSDVLAWSYDSGPGDWVSGATDIVSFVDSPVLNASKIGTPSSSYPLSSVVREQLSAASGVVNASITIDLNSIDSQIVDRYGPFYVDYGGTFGVSNSLPAGFTILQDLRPVSQGFKMTKSFSVPLRPDLSAAAAADWLEVMTQRITAALGSGRAMDQATVLGTRTVRSV